MTKIWKSIYYVGYFISRIGIRIATFAQDKQWEIDKRFYNIQ